MKSQKDKDGYIRVCLQKEKKRKMYFVHRLVARAFIPNPNNLPQINHINMVKADNNVDNLEWCTSKINVRYSQAKKINQLSMNGDFIKTWDCMSDASNELKIDLANISACCRHYGRIKSAGGFKWEYADTQ